MASARRCVAGVHSSPHHHANERRVAVKPGPRCLTIREVAVRWRTRPARVRAMVATGELPAILVGTAVRITPEALAQAEQGMTVRPAKRRRRETIPPEVLAILND